MSSSRLRDAFAGLQVIAGNAPVPLDPIDRKFLKVVSEMKFDRAIRPSVVRPDVEAKWSKAKDSRDFSSITRSDIRNLLWSPAIALTSEFFEILVQRQIVLRRAGVKGLVYCLASRWSEVIEGQLHLQAYTQRIKALSSTDYLDLVSPYIFSEQGHLRFAKELLLSRLVPSSHFSEIFGLVMPSTTYETEVINEVANSAHKIALDADPTVRDWFYTNILQGLDKSRLLKCLGKIVAEIEQASADDAKEELKAFILTHPNLGDPRLPGFEGNWVKDDPVTQLVVEWLSQSDIVFFFELFFQDKEDNQGRKAFWLAYAHAIRGTRVVISAADKRRLFRKLAEMDVRKVNKNIFGDLKDASVQATAFIMDFGTFKVVEFSEPNHSCYFYSQSANFKFNDRGAFWSTKVFDIYDLKNTRTATRRLSHQPRAGWGPK